MRPDEPMADALQQAIARYAKKTRKLLREAARGDAEAVHDARTTVRRVREGLVVMGRTVFEGRTTARLEDKLHDVERTLGATRDDDVLLADLDAWCGENDGAREGVAALRAMVERKRAKHLRSAKRALARDRSVKALRAMDGFFRGGPHDLVRGAESPKASPSLVRHFVASETWRGYEEVLAYESMPAEIPVVHQVRAACRRLRYRIDLFDEALPREAARIAEVLHHSQSRLGELHDHAVAVGRVDVWIAKGRLARCAPVDAYLDRRRRAMDDTRRVFGAEWRTITSDAFRSALAHAVSGTVGTEPASFAATLQ